MVIIVDKQAIYKTMIKVKLKKKTNAVSSHKVLRILIERKLQGRILVKLQKVKTLKSENFQQNNLVK